jgi:hypothetical protein
VDGLVCWLGCWSGVDPLLPPVCANAMPETSISANTNLLFMSLLLQKSKSARRARASFIARQRPLTPAEVVNADVCLETS